MTEQEKRLHRCCFSGHRPEKLRTDEATIKAWLEKQVDQAIADGYTTFITGMAMGVDLWAGQIVVERRRSNSSLHLIAAVPWPGFAAKWKDQWKGQYETVLHAADLVINVREAYEKNVFQLRNEWMVNHSQRIIAYFNGERGGTLATIDYALKSHIELCAGGIVPDFSSYVAYDFETTGLSADKDEIIEIGTVRVVNSKSHHRPVDGDGGDRGSGRDEDCGVQLQTAACAKTVLEICAFKCECADKREMVRGGALGRWPELRFHTGRS